MVSVEQVKAAAVNAAAIKNAEGIVSKKKYKVLNKSSDDSYLYGEFAGSGSSDYKVYVDLDGGIRAKCSCPSRQIPCKHALALMLLGAKGFITDIVEIPEEVSSKRDKREKTKEKAKEKIESGELSKADISKQKLLMQGLEYLQNSLSYILKGGLKKYRDDKSKELDKIYKALGDNKLTGTQTVFLKFKEDVENGREESAINNLILLNTIVKKAKIDIEEKIKSNKQEIKKDSTLEALVTTSRRQEELEAAGLIKENRDLIQLSLFIKNKNSALESYNAVYLDIEDGEIYTTRNYSNYTISNGDEDTKLKPLRVKKFFIYPGEKFNKIKLGEFEEFKINDNVLSQVLKVVEKSYKEAVKEVKQYFNNPLVFEEGYFLVSYNKLYSNEECIWIQNKEEETLCLNNTRVLNCISEDFYEGVILIKAHKNLTEGKLIYEGLSVISKKGILYLI